MDPKQASTNLIETIKKAATSSAIDNETALKVLHNAVQDAYEAVGDNAMGVRALELAIWEMPAFKDDDLIGAIYSLVNSHCTMLIEEEFIGSIEDVRPITIACCEICYEDMHTAFNKFRSFVKVDRSSLN